MYDENGSPFGMSVKSANSGSVKTYYYEKNLQGDIVGIMNEAGYRVVTYTYDAWGNPYEPVYSYNSGVSSTDRSYAQLNPFRYRGYYYDVETGYYYLQTRYYNPEWGRFLNADGYINANGDILGYNMFAYCGNNPVMGYDPTGEWDWGTFLDIVVSVGAVVGGAVVGVATGVGVLAQTGNVGLAFTEGIAAGTATTGAINNTVNAFYYNFISDGKSTLEQNPEKSSYVDEGYISRWRRLDHVKSVLGGEYNQNAWRYYSEYNAHMYAWMVTGWAYGQDVPKISRFAKRAYHADIELEDWDDDPFVRIIIKAIGYLGN